MECTNPAGSSGPEWPAQEQAQERSPSVKRSLSRSSSHSRIWSVMVGGSTGVCKARVATLTLGTTPHNQAHAGRHLSLSYYLTGWDVGTGGWHPGTCPYLFEHYWVGPCPQEMDYLGEQENSEASRGKAGKASELSP